MNPGASTYQHQHNIGSTPVVVDPKFPPTEEYSQNNYIPSGGDFFSGHHLNHPQHHLQYGYHHQPPNNYPPNGGYGYSNYYHHQLPPNHAIHSQLRPALSMHTEPQNLPCPQNIPVSNTTNILQNLADIAPTVSQPASDVNSGVCSPASVGHTNQDSRGSPPGHGSSLQDLGIRLEDNGSDDHEEIDDDHMLESPLMDDDDDDDSESGDRVIYPWMKKIHVAGVGKFIFL